MRAGVRRSHGAGTRRLLDETTVCQVAIDLKWRLVSSGFLPPGATAIQAITFDETAGTNWEVAWHQESGTMTGAGKGD